MIGLYHDLMMLRTLLASKRVTAAAVDSDPRIAHDAGVSVIRMAGDEKALTEQILEDVTWIANLQGMINRMTVSKHGSAQRTLALRHLEDAQSRLLRELGEKPAN
jgi:hypothetical protein